MYTLGSKEARPCATDPKSADFARTRRTWPDMLRNNSMTWHEFDLKFSVHVLIFSKQGFSKFGGDPSFYASYSLGT